MEKKEIQSIISEIIEEIDPIAEFNEETDLLDEILDSMSILYLVAEVLRRTKIEIPMQEITIDNFSNLENIVALAERYSKIN